MAALQVDSPYADIYRAINSYDHLLQQIRNFYRKGTTSCHRLRSTIATHLCRHKQLGDHNPAFLDWGIGHGYLTAPVADAPSLSSPSSSCHAISLPSSSSSSSPSPSVVITSSSPLRYPSSRLRDPPPYVRDLLPSVRLVHINGDGQCSVHAIAFGVDPSLDDDVARVQLVRRQLHEELARWGEEKWIQRIPSFGIRELIGDAGDQRRTYDIYLDYLSNDALRTTWLDHAVFYLASSLYQVEFIILAEVSGVGDNRTLYHRRVLECARPRRTVFVWHSHTHYEVMDVHADDEVLTVQLICSLRPAGISSRKDRDYDLWKASLAADASTERKTSRVMKTMMDAESGERTDGTAGGQ
jgi:hypothetical protein